MRVVSLLLLVLVAAPAAALVTRPLAGRASSPALRLRGGLGVIDPTMVAKVATGLLSANSAFVALAPEKAAELSGIKLGDRSVWLLEYNGHVLLRGAIFAAMGLTGSTIKNAVAWSCVPYAVFVLQGILQDRPEKMGVKVTGQYLILAIQAFMMHTCWTNAKYADTALKATLPSHAAKSWGIPSPTESDLLLIKTLGWYIGIYATALFSVLQGNPVVTVVGHGWLVAFLAGIDALFISKIPQKLGVATGPCYASLVLCALVPAFTLL